MGRVGGERRFTWAFHKFDLIIVNVIVDGEWNSFERTCRELSQLRRSGGVSETPFAFRATDG